MGRAFKSVGLVIYQVFGMRQGGKNKILRGSMKCLCTHTFAILINNGYDIENILNTSPKISFSSKEI